MSPCEGGISITNIVSQYGKCFSMSIFDRVKVHSSKSFLYIKQPFLMTQMWQKGKM